MKKLLLFLLSVSFISQASAKNIEQDIVATYESRFIRMALRPQISKQQWQFMRSKNRVEKRMNNQQQIEVWEKDKNSISFTRIFNDYKRIVEYAAGDLRSLGQYPRWELIQHIINPDVLEKLQNVEEKKVLGYSATLYKGQVNGIDIEITWLNDVNLPAVIRQVSRAGETSVHLKTLDEKNKDNWPVVDTSDYLAIDYADLGDNEADPVWSKLALDQHHGHKH